MKQIPENTGKDETMITEQVHKYHSSNPFISQLSVVIEEKPVRKIIGSKYQNVVNESTGEVESQKLLVLGEKKIVDKQEFYKIFMGEIKSFFQLSNTAMNLFEYVMEKIQYNKDKICLYKPDVMSTLKISRTTCHRCIVQLLDAQIIAKADTDNCYFVNPNVAFKGDRIALWKEYQMKDTINAYSEIHEKSTYVREEESTYGNSNTNENI